MGLRISAVIYERPVSLSDGERLETTQGGRSCRENAPMPNWGSDLATLGKRYYCGEQLLFTRRFNKSLLYKYQSGPDILLRIR